MLEFLAIIMVAMGGAITGTAMMINTILGDQDRDEAGEIVESPGLIARMRERIFAALGYDATSARRI